MKALDAALRRWAVDAVAPGADVTEVRGLRDGGSPWLVRYVHDGGSGAVVVRVARVDDVAMLQTEVAALAVAAEHGLPAPRVLASDLTGGNPALVIELLPGGSRIPLEPPVARLRTLGAAAARLNTITPEPHPALPRRTRPIGDIDFAALRRAKPAQPLLVEAETRIAKRPVPGSDRFVHGDLWQGNALWQGDSLSGLIDWDCAGVGPAGVDMGSLRCDAAMSFNIAAADEILRGWEEAAGEPAPDVAYWDVVAALSTPPEMDWFVGAIAGQGRPDLTREILVERRDDFLRDALRRLSAGT
jgi:Ser/Thr protein kinase RdoA (MazF antagonist)